ncbi:hypothetical protein VN97_g12364 [Penicillium thymicola]|uniref:Uncharacterized protein n=1 Tax=Penicillium thymicola TaxID=293382 RepID=A0AAI9X2I8_PENTH|nr:hypothetical protein VN97_g12364 [Penicillium thymicola]
MAIWWGAPTPGDLVLGAWHGYASFQHIWNAYKANRANMQPVSNSDHVAFPKTDSRSKMENPVFQRLLNLSYSGPGTLELPSAKPLRRRLRDAVTVQQESQLLDLPEDAKVSLASDFWTSPFQQAFMAITVYFIDKAWNYREMLLGFEPLHGSQTGINLSDVLHQLLKERKLLDRIFSVTTDNATNNETLIRALQEKLISTGAIGSREYIARVPCMAHVIQLCLKQLLGHIRAAPKNKEVKTFWSDTQAIGLRDSANHGDVAHVLAKVSLESS